MADFADLCSISTPRKEKDETQGAKAAKIIIVDFASENRTFVRTNVPLFGTWAIAVGQRSGAGRPG